MKSVINREGYKYMRAYGVRRWDRCCCPGHDKFPGESYKNRRSKKALARSKKQSRNIARVRTRMWICSLRKMENFTD